MVKVDIKKLKRQIFRDEGSNSIIGKTIKRSFSTLWGAERPAYTAGLVIAVHVPTHRISIKLLYLAPYVIMINCSKCSTH
jgi:hypothetical protein